MPDEKEKERKFAKDFLEKWTRAEREEGPADEALARVDEALKASPDDPTLWFRRASLLTDLERWDEALVAFRRVEALDTAFPRLYVGLSFVLTRLGRVEEAADAQRRSLGAVGMDRERERDAEQALEALAEDLRKETTEEEAGKALEELGTIVGAPAPEPPAPEEAVSEEDLEAKLARWAAAGYDVAPLREIMDQEPDRTRTAFFQFEQNIRKVEVLRETVDTLSPEGLEADIARIRDRFLAPYQIWRIEADMATLLEKADARDRAARARVAAPPPAVRRPPGIAAPPAAVGRVNGLINGTGRVNGMARGRVNGLINGVVRARSGLTNGLTNGIGFTNGLGASRYARDQRRRWARILLIPLVAVSLLNVTLLLPPEAEPALGGVQVDGDFREWERVPSYNQPSSAANPDVDLLEYASRFADRRLSLYARVGGAIFPDTTAYDVLYAYVDVDGDAATGYDGDQIGAELLVEVLGGNGSVMQASTWIWSGTDREDWGGWAGGRTVLAAARGSEVELQIDVDAVEDIVGADAFDDERAAVRIVLDDQAGSSSESMLAFGPAPGALRVVQSSAPANDTVPAALANFLVLDLSAEGGPVNVTSATIGLGPGTPSLTPLSPVFVLPGAPPVTVILRVDATGLPAGSLLSAEVLSVETDRPATISGGPARAYVGSLPPGPVADGLFREWTSLTNDTDAPAVSNPHVDIVQHASAARNATAFSFARVAGMALGDRDAPWGRSRPLPGPASAPGPPVPPTKRVGEDLFRVFYDANGTAGGMPIGGIVADAFLEVRGRHGRVQQVQGHEWQQGDWVRQGTAWAVADGDRIETSLDLPGRDFRGAAYVIETFDWRRTRDATDAGGVRGTRGAPGGVSFVGAYDAFLPATADGWIAFAAGGLDVSWRLPALWSLGGEGRTLIAKPSPVPLAAHDSGGAFRGAYGADADVAYAAEADRLKETFTFRSPPSLGGGDMLFEFPIHRHADLMTYATGETVGDEVLVDGPLSFVDGRGLSLTFAQPWIEDARGRRVDLRFRWAEDLVRIEVSGAWLRDAAYPVVLDPTVSYTIRNQGASADDGEQFGYSTAIGDFNGDGRADVLVGAPNNNKNNGALTTGHGYAYVFYGPFSADDTSPDVWINPGDITAVRFGFSVAAGKFNNDAYWDALVARLALDTLAIGNTSIYHGASGWSGEETTPDVEFVAPSDAKNHGYAVAAGNLDNANYDDVIIGEPGRDFSPDLGTEGVAYVFMSPFASSETASDYRLIPSSNVNGQLGKSLAVGKIDSDAYADIVVGEPNANTNKGRVQWYAGSHFTSGSGDVSPDATIDGLTAGDQFGLSVSVGKVDGDAYADVAVGAPFRTTSTGAAYVFLANSGGTGLTSGASADASFAGEATNEQFGWSVLLVDFDDDGSAGLAVGANLAAGGGTSRGKFYWYDDPINDATVDETLTGSQTNERFGQSLAAGRFASETRTVVVIGAYLWDDSVNDNDGRAVVAMVPESVELLMAVSALIAVGGSIQRRRLVRKR